MLAFRSRVKRPTGDEVFLRHMVLSHYAFGLVIVTRCALVLKGYINIPTPKLLLKLELRYTDLKDLQGKKRSHLTFLNTQTFIN